VEKEYWAWAKMFNTSLPLLFEILIVPISTHEELCLLGYNAVQSVESHPLFWRNMSPSSGFEE
jgi:hypothetical protein